MKEIKNYPNYLINKNGQIYSKYHKKYLKPAISGCQYYSVCLTNNKKSKTNLIHRLLAENFIDNPLNFKCVNHINGIKTDNRIENLEWCSYSQNILHSFKLGMSKISEKNKIANKKANGKIVLDLSTGIFYDTIADAEKAKGYKKNVLGQYLNGKRINKTSLIFI